MKIIILLTIFTFTLFSETLTFGVIPRYAPEVTIKKFQPIIDKLEKELHVTIKLITTSSVAEFKRKVKTGKFDICYTNPLHYVAMHNLFGYEAIAHEDIELFGIIVVHKDSPINSVKELKGKKVAFPAPSAYAATKMNRFGIYTLHHFNISSDAHYVGTLHNVMQAVVDKRVLAGGTALDVYKRTPQLNKKLKIIFKTYAGTPHPIATHPRIHNIKDKIQTILTSMSSKELKGTAFKHIVQTSDAKYKDTYELLHQDLNIE